MERRLNAWSKPPREMHNHTMDSTRWYDVHFRAGDIVIATWAKTGTTWVQQIVGQLIFAAAADIPVFDRSPWVENRCFPKRTMIELLEAQTHRRFMKTHLPADALVYDPAVKYIYVGREGRDVLWSWYNHHRHLTPLVYEMLEGTPGLVGPPLEPPAEDVRQYFHEWLDKDGFPLWPYWSHVRSWWDLRGRDNVLLLHYSELQADLATQIRRIARFLEIEVDPALLPRVCEHCSFSYMKANAASLSSTLRVALLGGANTFIHRGEGGRWRSVLTPEDIGKYERRMHENLTPECVAWLTHVVEPRPVESQIRGRVADGIAS